MKKITFYNTFEPVVPLYSDLFPYLEQRSFEVDAVVSKGLYRNEESNISKNLCLSWVPFFWSTNKRICSLFYFLFCPFVIFFKKSDLNVFLTQPPLFFIIGSMISRLKRTPYIIHVMDMYPDLLVDAGRLKANSIIYKILLKLSMNSYFKANKVVVIGQCMKDRLIKKGVSEDIIEIIPNWANFQLKNIKKSNNLFISKFGLKDKFIITYSGNMGQSHYFDSIIKVAKELEYIEAIKFIFIGYGSKRLLIENAIQDGAKNILLFDYQPIDLLSHSLSAADLHFVSLDFGFEAKVVPSKFYGMLACARPVIYEGSELSEIAYTIKSANCGAIINLGHWESLKNIVLKYYNNQELIQSLGNNSLSYYQDQNCRDSLVKNYFEVINNIITCNELVTTP